TAACRKRAEKSGAQRGAKTGEIPGRTGQIGPSPCRLTAVARPWPMFSRFRKDAPPRPATAQGQAPAASPAPAAMPLPGATPARPQGTSLIRPTTMTAAARVAAEAKPVDKEQKRRERLMELKLEIHKRLLEN